VNYIRAGSLCRIAKGVEGSDIGLQGALQNVNKGAEETHEKLIQENIKVAQSRNHKTV
jgi:hypothetical protein